MQIPVVTTLMAKGAFPDSHPLCARMPGMHGSKYANWAMNRADLLITIGARFDDRVTGKLDAFAPGARVIHWTSTRRRSRRTATPTSRSSASCGRCCRR